MKSCESALPAFASCRLVRTGNESDRNSVASHAPLGLSAGYTAVCTARAFERNGRTVQTPGWISYGFVTSAIPRPVMQSCRARTLPLVGTLLGHRRHRARPMHGPFRGFAWAISGSFRPGISRIFRAILNYFRSATPGGALSIVFSRVYRL